MTIITLTTIIDAPAERCFDLSRSIELHILSTNKTGERAVAGKTTGLMEAGETVTWEAVHFGIKQQLTTRIVKMAHSTFFSDEMVKGAFKSMYHEHIFESADGKAIMTDIFRYEVPYGVAGMVFDRIVLKRHMTKLLEERNKTIKNTAEGSGWINILK